MRQIFSFTFAGDSCQIPFVLLCHFHFSHIVKFPFIHHSCEQSSRCQHATTCFLNLCKWCYSAVIVTRGRAGRLLIGGLLVRSVPATWGGIKSEGAIALIDVVGWRIGCEHRMQIHQPIVTAQTHTHIRGTQMLEFLTNNRKLEQEMCSFVRRWAPKASSQTKRHKDWGGFVLQHITSLRRRVTG